MSGINRLQSKLNEILGLNEWGQRQIIPGSMDDEIVETNQQFGAGTIPSSKIKNLKVDTITITPTGYIRLGKDSFTDSTNAGYYFNGMYVGAASDANYLKYDVSAGTLVFKGSITGSTIIGGTIKTSDATYPDVLINSTGITIHGDKLFVKNTDGTVGGVLRTSSTLFTLEAETNRSLRLIAYNDFTINTHYDSNIMTYSSGTGDLAVKTGSGHATFEGRGNAYLTAVVGNVYVDGGGTVNIISGDNVINCSANILKLSSSKTPSASNDTGVTGSICWDANYIYVCTATDTWKRASIATW